MKNARSYFKTKFCQISYCVFFIAILIPALSSAQNRGKVEVVKDPLIDTLIARRSVLGKQVSATGDEPTSGYRVQIFFGSNRQAAYDAQAKINEEHPELRTYITYNEPNFKVRAGDFRTRLEAEKLMKEITPIFTSLFIIPEKINPPKQDNSND
ncbi:MAG TPA: SPOR domain-containing protein [Mucilaginibacter sp.]|jgi:hypothetical protein